jgi:hypothetical protein
MKSFAVVGLVTVRLRLVDWLVSPPRAVIMMVTVPSVAVLVAANDKVTVQGRLQGLLVKVVVTPLGRPVADKKTEVVVPLTRVASIEEATLVPPWATVMLLGEGAERVKTKAAACATMLGLAIVNKPETASIITTVTGPRFRRARVHFMVWTLIETI